MCFVPVGQELWLLWQLILHRLITGKVDFFCFQWDICLDFLKKCLLSNPLRFIMTFVKIADFDWLPG